MTAFLRVALGVVLVFLSRQISTDSWPPLLLGLLLDAAAFYLIVVTLWQAGRRELARRHEGVHQG